MKSRSARVGVDVDKPGRSEPDHAAIGIGEDGAGGFVIEPIGFERAVDEPLMTAIERLKRAAL